MEIVERKISELKPAEYNPRRLTAEQEKHLTASLTEFGFVDPIIVNTHPDRKNIIIGGHQRLKVWKKMGNKTVPTVEVQLDKEKERELNIRLNANTGEWDMALLNEFFTVPELEEWGLDLEWGREDDEYINQELYNREDDDPKQLMDIFVIPPFSILDTRQGYWQDRKKKWKELIGDFGESRKEVLGSGGLIINKNSSSWLENPKNGGGVSLFDPVLSEIIIKWFGLPNGNAIDPFAGDTAFGYVAASLGMNFTGIELRQEQADLNNERVKSIQARYICDDGRNILNHIDENSQDLLFSCPPYFDLEVYSDLPNDASNQKEYKDFLQILDTAFSNSIRCLKNNRFAVVVVGDVRDKDGFYINLISDIKNIFTSNGVNNYNELILTEIIGFGAIRANGNMKYRKVTKCHQNVLVFFKGNPKEIKNIYPDLRLDEDGSGDI